MAVQTLSNRQSFPGITGYHSVGFAAPSSSMASSPHDMQSRASFYPSFNMGANVYSTYPAYGFQPQPAYQTPVTMAQSYSTASSPTMMMANHMPQHHFANSPQSAPLPSADLPLSSMGTLKHESHIKSDPYEAKPIVSSASDLPIRSGPTVKHESRPDGSTAAAPGPIPATTPLVVKQDQSGVQWIAFEYSQNRIKHEYTIRCDVESVDLDALSSDFKKANCVYPRAFMPESDYQGNRYKYETECNALGWALAKLNPDLRDKRGLIQRANDSWRNSNQDPKMRSRRVRRQNKEQARKGRQGSASAQSSQGQLPPVQTAHQHQGRQHQSMMGLQSPGLPMGVDAYRHHQVLPPASQAGYTYLPPQAPGMGGQHLW